MVIPRFGSVGKESHWRLPTNKASLAMRMYRKCGKWACMGRAWVERKAVRETEYL